MQVGVTSQNTLKIDAVKRAYILNRIFVEVIGFKSDSKVGEQPVNEQTLEGARNRIFFINSHANNLDRIISIENGIFLEEGQWLDRAVVVVYNLQTHKEYIAYSDAVVFPIKYVEKTQQIGFEIMTVGQVMAEAGYVTNPKDPHLTISGISRQVYLENTILKLVGQVESVEL